MSDHLMLWSVIFFLLSGQMRHEYEHHGRRKYDGIFAVASYAFAMFLFLSGALS